VKSRTLQRMYGLTRSLGRPVLRKDVAPRVEEFVEQAMTSVGESASQAQPHVEVITPESIISPTAEGGPPRSLIDRLKDTRFWRWATGRKLPSSEEVRPPPPADTGLTEPAAQAVPRKESPLSPSTIGRFLWDNKKDIWDNKPDKSTIAMMGTLLGGTAVDGGILANDVAESEK